MNDPEESLPERFIAALFLTPIICLKCFIKGFILTLGAIAALKWLQIL